MDMLSKALAEHSAKSSEVKNLGVVRYKEAPSPFTPYLGLNLGVISLRVLMVVHESPLQAICSFTSSPLIQALVNLYLFRYLRNVYTLLFC